ncbi:hypothetical protein [Emticicia sp. C21]|uniref:hypothetical protein n=1 Tax=Emticicia sp. C21 TaxID=2302915 RepID=UPI000E354989|nr:hypothetical protein [Emticicia sp. C21]RFS18324.1 hypothetical protein D0T08_03480 [Emticicia sp. C21]
MKITLLFLLTAFGISTVSGQDSKKSSEKESDKMKVPVCTISGVNFAKGDTITIGQPSNANQRFSFIHRRFGVFEGIRELEKFRLSVEWSNRLVLINETYIVTEGLNKICYAEFKVGNDFRGWITLDNAIKTKEIVKLNSTDL